MNPWSLLLSKTERNKILNSTQDHIITKVKDSYFITENNESVVNYKKLQGFVALSDSTEEDGGFLCVPTCHKIIEQWAEANKSIGLDKKNEGRNFVSVPDRDPLSNQGQKIPVRAGSLVIWDSRLAHCNYPNNSDKFRYVQYIKMFPSQSSKKMPNFCKNRRLLVQELLSEMDTPFEPSELGKKLFGLEEW
jgi:ectoine hydroxylase-related dioxygenase (phytanoyl-CoA dioxygenase family)